MSLTKKSHAIIVATSNAQSLRQKLDENYLLNRDCQCLQLSSSQVALPIILNGGNINLFNAQWPHLQVTEIHFPLSKKAKALRTSPAVELKKHILLLLKRFSFSEELISEIPEKWEKHGDLILLPASSFSSPLWEKMDNLWPTVAECLKCKRIAKQSHVAPNGFRSSKVLLLLGENGIVTHIDNKIKYSYDVTKCMFSSGNITEKLRISKLDCSGEILVDLFAGIGYFTLPFLVHAKAEYVHACEWNPDAVFALKNNLEINGVSERCKIHFGDNRHLNLTSVADRVNLGLIPSSEDSWPVAVQVLKSSGGILHVHGNVTTNNNHLSKNMTNHNKGNKAATAQSALDLTTCDVSEENRCDTDSNALNILCCGHNEQDKDVMNKKGSVVSDCKQWSQKVQSEITQLLETSKGGHWQVEELHIELVKWYAPHVMHVVVDLNCKPVL